MADGYYRDVAKRLKKAGFHYVENKKGSHELWCRDDDGVCTIVPRNLKSRHTANGILSDAGIDHHY